jgi:hypothetical protein
MGRDFSIGSWQALRKRALVFERAGIELVDIR